MIEVLKSASDSQTNLSPSTESIIKALKICLKNNNLTFAGQNFIQTNGATIGVANSCSYSDLAIQPKDNAVIDAQNFSRNILFWTV